MKLDQTLEKVRITKKDGEKPKQQTKSKIPKKKQIELK